MHYESTTEGDMTNKERKKIVFGCQQPKMWLDRDWVLPPSQ